MASNNNKLRSLLGPALGVACAITLAGCTGGMGDLETYVDEVKARPPGRVPPIPEFTPYLTFEYSAHDLRDPFKLVRAPSVEEIAGGGANGLKPDQDRPKELLEDFPLDTLRMKGTLAQGSNFWGLVQAPDGTIHRIREGNYMGQNYGKVIEVSPGQIDLTEIIPDGLGGWMERSASLALGEEE
jgi:type IV pilus assembly protein PilP